MQLLSLIQMGYIRPNEVGVVLLGRIFRSPTVRPRVRVAPIQIVTARGVHNKLHAAQLTRHILLRSNQVRRRIESLLRRGTHSRRNEPRDIRRLFAVRIDLQSMDLSVVNIILGVHQRNNVSDLVVNVLQRKKNVIKIRMAKFTK